MDVLTSRRIVLLGKTGAGKSSLANIIFGEKLFTTNHSPNAENTGCQAITKSVNGRSITLIDTPGFFDTGRSEEDLKPEIVRCITECAPGPHAFLIVLKVEKYTKHEQAVIEKICQYFSEDALKYAVIVFTHGDQLHEEMKIEDFVSQSENLSDLVKKCGGRCHVVDSKYWESNEGESYRSNQLQVAELLNTIDEMIEAKQGSCYTNEMLQAVNTEIRREEQLIRQTSGNMSEGEISEKAKVSVFHTLLMRSAAIAAGVLLGALLGVAEMVMETATCFQDIVNISATAEGRALLTLAAQRGGFRGGMSAYNTSRESQNLQQAVGEAAQAVWNQSGLAANLNKK